MNKSHSQRFAHIKRGIRHIPQISQCDGAHFSDVEYVKALRDLFEAHLLLWRPHIFKLKMSFLGLIRGFYIERALYGWLRELKFIQDQPLPLHTATNHIAWIRISAYVCVNVYF